MDVFGAVRESVSAEDAARLYGLEIDYHGKARCPYHGDRHPSMTFHKGRFRCWACNASGDAIDLTGHLFGLDGLGAVRKLNTDFSLALPLDRKPTQEEREAAQKTRRIREQHKAFEAWRGVFLDRLNAAIRAGNKLDISDPEKLTKQEYTALKMKPIFEYWADLLEAGTPQDQISVYRERGDIEKWILRVLPNT